MLSRRLFNSFLSAGGLAGAICLSPAAFAHREAASSTEILWADDSQSLNITHVMHTHDAQRALFHMGRLDKPDLSPLKAQAILALYISETFAISADDVPLSLNIIGAEIIGRNVFVYQDVSLVARPKTLIIDPYMFQTAVIDFLNHIDVHTDDGVKSFRRTKNSSPFRVPFY